MIRLNSSEDNLPILIYDTDLIVCVIRLAEVPAGEMHDESKSIPERTRIDMRSGACFLVRETPDEIDVMIKAEDGITAVSAG